MKTSFSKRLRRFSIASAVALLVQLLVPALILPAAAAGNMTYTMVRTDRMKVNTTTTGTVCAKPTSSGTEAKAVVTFPSVTNYAVGAFGTWTVSTATTTGWPKDPADGTTSATAWPSIAAPGSGDVSGQAVTFGSGDLTAGTWYCFNWTTAAALTINNVAAAPNLTGTVETQTSGAAAIDDGSYALATVTNDQIGVTATVAPSFNFSLSSNSAALGTLSTSSPTASSTINARVDTNAFKGWNIWAADPAGSPGLTSAAASKTIAFSPGVGSSASALSNGVEGYNLGAATATQTSGSGTVSIDGNFASGGVSYKGGGLDGVPRIVAVSTGTANNAVVPLTVNASISSITPAANDYAGTMTLIAAGRF